MNADGRRQMPSKINVATFILTYLFAWWPVFALSSYAAAGPTRQKTIILLRKIPIQ
jgi:hypothetical protein